MGTQHRDEPSGLVLHDPVRQGEDGLVLMVGGRTVPLLMQGEPVRAFLPGWRAELLHVGFAPLFLLELVHDDGGRATWFLDFRMQRIADAVDRLGPELTALLCQQAAPVLEAMLGAVLREAVPALDAHGLAFLRLNDTTRQAIAIACRDRLLRRPSLMLVDQLMPASLFCRSRVDGALHPIGRAHLAAALERDWQDRLIAALRGGALAWPSPIDGATLVAQGCLCLDDFHFAYRFVDERYDLVFFAVVADHYSRVGGLWFPQLGLMVAGPEERTRGVAGIQLLPHLAHWIVTHVAQWAASLVPTLARGADRSVPARFASVMRGRDGVHIGHQLWNELSGIDHLLREAPDVPLPEWIVPDAQEGIELYGPIDEVFPALRGHVERGLAGRAALIRHVYERGILPLRITREHVSAQLRQRILATLRPSARVQGALAAVERRGPVLLIGLRVENRTLCDLGGFLARLAEAIAARHPTAALVLDGHNRRGEAGAVIESHAESRARRSPLEVERELAAGLRERFAASPILIADTIGQPIAASLAWAARCDGLVSIWGASLAKYRWICNKPGYVLTSRTNLAQRRDLHIYDSPITMDHPTRLQFVDPALVTDRPEASLLVDAAPGHASFFNFDIDTAAVIAAILAMIGDHAPGPAA